MRLTNLTILIVLFFCLVFNLANAQFQTDSEFKNNSVFGSFGTIILSNQASLSYERTVFSKKKLRTRVKLSYGNFFSNNLDFDTGAQIFDSYLSLSAVQLFGIVEASAGITGTRFTLAPGFEPDPNVDYTEQMNGLTFIGNIGLRFEKDQFMFRVGVGNFELLYAGIGVNF